MSLVSGPHMCLLWAAHIGLSVGNPYVSNKGVTIWAWPYRAIPHATHIGLVSRSHMGLLWAAHMGLAVWDPYGRAYMRKPVYIPHWAHMGLLSGFFMGVPISA